MWYNSDKAAIKLYFYGRPTGMADYTMYGFAFMV